jgi:hypothetical protein
MGRHVVVLESRPCGLGLVMVKCSLLYYGFGDLRVSGRIEIQLEKRFPAKTSGRIQLEKSLAKGVAERSLR